MQFLVRLQGVTITVADKITVSQISFVSGHISFATKRPQSHCGSLVCYNYGDNARPVAETIINWRLNCV